jgi:ABC-type Fe3+ transport system permease subunit
MALLDADGVRAARRAALPLMWPWLGAAFAVAAVLALTEYSVCHLCLVQTWNTEVLAEIQLLDAAGRGFVLAWPLLAVALAAAMPLWFMRRRIGEALLDVATIEDDGAATARRSAAGAVPCLAAAGTLLAPWAFFAVNLQRPAALWSAWPVYVDEWRDGLLYAGGAALIAAWLALGVDCLLTAPRASAWRRLRPAGIALMVVAALAVLSPPALVGDAFLATYIRVPAIADHWPVVSALTAARFSVIAMLLVRLGGRLSHPQYAEMAATDGADFARFYLRVHLPARLPAAAAGGLAVGLLAFTEVAATQLVKPAGVKSMATTMLNQIHFGRSDETLAMSLAMMLLAALFAGAAMLGARARRR